jgi:hypothetical protein
MGTENGKGEILTATISQRYFMARGTGAFLNYLHLDVATIGLALFFVLAGGLARNLDLITSMESAIPVLSLSAEPPALAGDSKRQARPLAPAMGAALDYVAQRYRIAPEALQPIFETAQAAARERQLDPLLIIAVIAIESRFNPFSQSPVGAQGLMQIVPRFHQDKIVKATGEQPFLDPVRNVQLGAQILQESIRRQGGLVEGLQYYAGALDDDERGYANKVLAEKLRLEQASRRKDGASA